MTPDLPDILRHLAGRDRGLPRVCIDTQKPMKGSHGWMSMFDCARRAGRIGLAAECARSVALTHDAPNVVVKSRRVAVRRSVMAAGSTRFALSMATCPCTGCRRRALTGWT